MRKLITLILILSSCNYINTDKKRTDKAETYKLFFYENQKTFDKIVKRITEDTTFNSQRQYIEASEFDDLTKKEFRRLEITQISIDKADCGQYEVEFRTTWTEFPIGQMYLSKGCTDDKSIKDAYWTDGNFIEVWGLGDGWIIWVDSDIM